MAPPHESNKDTRALREAITPRCELSITPTLQERVRDLLQQHRDGAPAAAAPTPDGATLAACIVLHARAEPQLVLQAVNSADDAVVAREARLLCDAAITSAPETHRERMLLRVSAACSAPPHARGACWLPLARAAAFCSPAFIDVLDVGTACRAAACGRGAGEKPAADACPLLCALVCGNAELFSALLARQGGAQQHSHPCLGACSHIKSAMLLAAERRDKLAQLKELLARPRIDHGELCVRLVNTAIFACNGDALVAIVQRYGLAHIVTRAACFTTKINKRAIVLHLNENDLHGTAHSIACWAALYSERCADTVPYHNSDTLREVIQASLPLGAGKRALRLYGPIDEPMIEELYGIGASLPQTNIDISGAQLARDSDIGALCALVSRHKANLVISEDTVRCNVILAARLACARRHDCEIWFAKQARERRHPIALGTGHMDSDVLKRWTDYGIYGRHATALQQHISHLASVPRSILRPVVCDMQLSRAVTSSVAAPALCELSQACGLVDGNSDAKGAALVQWSEAVHVLVRRRLPALAALIERLYAYHQMDAPNLLQRLPLELLYGLFDALLLYNNNGL